MQKYRLVSDFGYGDKSWVERDLTESEAIEALSDRGRRNAETIEEALDNDSIYYVERDYPEDVEDWDWMDS